MCPRAAGARNFPASDRVPDRERSLLTAPRAAGERGHMENVTADPSGVLVYDQIGLVQTSPEYLG